MLTGFVCVYVCACVRVCVCMCVCLFLCLLFHLKGFLPSATMSGTHLRIEMSDLVL